MDGIVGTLRLGWDALRLKPEAFDRMKASANPAMRGLVFLLVVGLVIAVLNLAGTALEWASSPSQTEMRDTIYRSLTGMEWFREVASQTPDFVPEFERYYDMGWQVFPRLFGAPDVGGAALGIIGTPLGLLIRWIIYGLLAYLFARWLGGTGSLSQTLGVLALAAAPQMLNVLNVLPFVGLGNLVGVWHVLCIFVGLRVAHGLSWQRSLWATLLPFILGLVLVLIAACLGSAALGIAIRGGQS